MTSFNRSLVGASTILFLVFLSASPAVAQTQVAGAIPPPNVIVPNYSGVLIGETGSLEAGAFVARANDSSSGWYNPAGLARAETSSVSGSAGMFLWTKVNPESLPNPGGSFSQVPAMFGLVLKNPFGLEGWSGGLSIARFAAWEQETSSQLVLGIADYNERFGYNTDSGFWRTVGSVGAGYASDGPWRVGGSVDVEIMSLRRTSTISDALQAPTGLQAVVVSTRGDASAVNMRFSFGAQFDLSSSLRFGATFKTPGIGFLQKGSVSMDGLVHEGQATASTSFFDPNGQAKYKVPFEMTFAGAYVADKAQVELDVKVYQGAGAYASFRSTNPVVVIFDDGSGSRPTVEQQAFPDRVIDSKGIVNVALGGHLQISEGWRLHGGFNTNYSPVGPTDNVFQKVDLYGFSTGISGSTRHIAGSAGIYYQAGTSAQVVVRELSSGQELKTKIKVASLGIVYSVSYRF